MTVACAVLPSPSQGTTTPPGALASAKKPSVRKKYSESKLSSSIDQYETDPNQALFLSKTKEWPTAWCYTEAPSTSTRPVEPDAPDTMHMAAFGASTDAVQFPHVVTAAQIQSGTFIATRGARVALRRIPPPREQEQVQQGSNNEATYIVERRTGLFWRKRHTFLMKTMSNRPSTHQDPAKSTTREAYMQVMAQRASLGSAGVVPALHYAGLEDAWNPTSFLVMDYIDPARQQLHKNGVGKYPMNDHQFLSVAHSLMDVVSHMLDAGVSHNDIALRNIIILSDYRVALIDFGESCLLFFDRVAGDVDFRERFTCHIFTYRLNPPSAVCKSWAKHTLHFAGYSDVRTTFFVLAELLSSTEGVSSEAREHFKRVLNTHLIESNGDSNSIYSGVSLFNVGEGGRSCADFRSPLPDDLNRVHEKARALTRDARLLLRDVYEELNGSRTDSSASTTAVSTSPGAVSTPLWAVSTSPWRESAPLGGAISASVPEASTPSPRGAR